MVASIKWVEDKSSKNAAIINPAGSEADAPIYGRQCRPLAFAKLARELDNIRRHRWRWFGS